MDQFEVEEFWKALNRLYEATDKLQVATEALRDVAQAHESRLDKIEVVQEWLARRERDREKRERGE
jgi:hypothetical protein